MALVSGCSCFACPEQPWRWQGSGCTRAGLPALPAPRLIDGAAGERLFVQGQASHLTA